MDDQYKRLLKAAKTLKGWRAPSEIAIELSTRNYSVSDQTINNWSRRGISTEGILRVSEIIGCRPLWLELGTGEMRDNNPQTATLSSPELQHLISRVIELESSGASSPQLIHALEAILDLAAPTTSPSSYQGLDNLEAE